MQKNTKRMFKKIVEMFGQKIANLVKLLSHDKNTNYNTYLLKLANYPTAFDVKLLDLLDNLLDNPTLKQKEKYRSALKYVTGKGIKINSKIKDELFKLAGI